MLEFIFAIISCLGIEGQRVKKVEIENLKALGR